MPPQPRQLSRAFKILIAIPVFVAAAVFLLAIHHPNTGPSLGDLGGNTDKWWTREDRPAPSPTPLGATAPTPKVIYMQPQPTPVPTPKQAAQCDDPCQRYKKALISEISVAQPGDNTLETPQLIGPNAVPSPGAIAVSTQPAPPHTILAWTWLYAVLESGVSSDHLGDVLARVSQDVKDSVTQTETLIPAGSRLHGYQRGRDQVQQNDTSLLIEFDTLTFPNGGEIALPRAAAADAEGYPGLHDEVNNHEVKTWVPALLVAGINASTMLASNPTYGSANGYTGEQMAMAGAAQSLGAQAQARLLANLQQLKPTITIRPGTILRVLVNRDMVFDHAYQQQ